MAICQLPVKPWGGEADALAPVMFHSAWGLNLFEVVLHKAPTMHFQISAAADA